MRGLRELQVGKPQWLFGGVLRGSCLGFARCPGLTRLGCLWLNLGQFRDGLIFAKPQDCVHELVQHLRLSHAFFEAGGLFEHLADPLEFAGHFLVRGGLLDAEKEDSRICASLAEFIREERVEHDRELKIELSRDLVCGQSPLDREL